jgi:CrcB protein
VSAVLVWCGVAVCGGLGAVLRFVVDGAVLRRLATGLPLGTWVVNLSGAFVLGVLDGLVLPHDAALVVGTGVIGSYTTFSTWMLETQRLGEERRSGAAALNLALSLTGGLLLAWVGLRIGGVW